MAMMNGTATLALLALLAQPAIPTQREEAPQMEPLCVLNLEPGPGNPRNSEGDFVQLRDGRILFVYTHFTGSASDFGSAHLAGRFSKDGGRTWTGADTPILPNEGGMNTMSVSLLRLQSGEIALFYLRKNSKSDCRPFMRVSRDEAATWEDPVLCIEPLGYFVVNNDRVGQLKGGRLVVPASRHSLPGEEFTSRGQALCYLSDDNGATWRPSESVLEAPAESKSGLQEPGVVALGDGRLLMWCRTDLGCQYQSFSKDDGVTWSPARPSQIRSPVSPATIEPIPGTNRLLMVWNDHSRIPPALQGKRTPLTLGISQDRAGSWTKVMTLEDDPDGWYCYTAMEFVEDAVLLAYCAGDSTVGGLNRTRILRVELNRLPK